MILVFDTETTGLALHPDAPIEKQPKMIEFGGVLLDHRTGEIIDELSLMCNPGEPITEEITKITGITDADVKDARKFKDLLPFLHDFFGRAFCLIAHNLPFDRSIIAGELARHGISNFPWPQDGVCTVGLYKEQWGRQAKLTELYESVMGRPLAQTHRALDDVKALVEIIQKEEIWRLVS